jgi:hypothetical protein
MRFPSNVVTYPDRFLIPEVAPGLLVAPAAQIFVYAAVFAVCGPPGISVASVTVQSVQPAVEYVDTSE